MYNKVKVSGERYQRGIDTSLSVEKIHITVIASIAYLMESVPQMPDYHTILLLPFSQVLSRINQHISLEYDIGICKDG